MVYFEGFTPFFTGQFWRPPMEPCGFTRERGNPAALDLALIDLALLK
jgi:hypothetical protein